MSWKTINALYFIQSKWISSEVTVSAKIEKKNGCHKERGLRYVRQTIGSDSLEDNIIGALHTYILTLKT